MGLNKIIFKQAEKIIVLLFSSNRGIKLKEL